MVKVTFTESNKTLSLQLEGHAGQAEAGKDIVCASASILAYTVAQIVDMAQYEGGLKTDPIIDLESGEAVISCEPTDDRYAEMLHAYQVAEVGYILLVNSYPEYVELKSFGQA